jgi:hypothetical protein
MFCSPTMALHSCNFIQPDKHLCVLSLSLLTGKGMMVVCDPLNCMMILWTDLSFPKSHHQVTMNMSQMGMTMGTMGMTTSQMKMTMKPTRMVIMFVMPLPPLLSLAESTLARTPWMLLTTASMKELERW